MLSSRPRGLIIDLNGTLYFRERALPGAAQAVAQLRAQGFKLRFMTNTDTKTRRQLQELIASYGFDLPANEVFSAAHVTYEYLRRNRLRFMGLLPDSLREDFADLLWDEEKPDCILVGENREAIDYPMLNRMFGHLMRGAELVVMQPNRHYYLADGPHLDTGSFGALFEYATGLQAHIMAKPSASFFDMVLKDMKLAAQDVLVVGDDIETDIVGAARVGASSLLVQTGKYRPGDEYLSSIKPDLVLPSLAELPAVLEKS